MKSGLFQLFFDTSNEFVAFSIDFMKNLDDNVDERRKIFKEIFREIIVPKEPVTDKEEIDSGKNCDIEKNL